MVDIFTLFLTHALMLIAGWRLLSRGDLDRETAQSETGVPAKPAGRARRKVTRYRPEAPTGQGRDHA